MESSPDRTSSSTGSQDPILDPERGLNGLISGKCQRSFVRIGKIPFPIRKGRLASDSVLYFAILVTTLCIAQTVYLYYLRAGLVRVENDPYDNTFWNTEWHSPSVWDMQRQAFVHNARPLPIHSHNDYWRSIPLHEALASGCISVEADVHLDKGDLYIGHTRAGGKDQTLRAMYLQPLHRMLDSQNTNLTAPEWRGIFNSSPHQTTILLIDIKTADAPTLAQLSIQLQPLRASNYLTHWNGTHRITRPLTIVASGTTQFSSILALNGPHNRDIFFDAPLSNLRSLADDYTRTPPRYAYNISNSYYASTEFANARLHAMRRSNSTWAPSSAAAESDMAASQLEQARVRGLVSRYWATPEGPPNLRDVVWRVLVDAGVGVLNMDDLGAVRARAGGWGRL